MLVSESGRRVSGGVAGGVIKEEATGWLSFLQPAHPTWLPGVQRAGGPWRVPAERWDCVFAPLDKGGKVPDLLSPMQGARDQAPLRRFPG